MFARCQPLDGAAGGFSDSRVRVVQKGFKPGDPGGILRFAQSGSRRDAQISQFMQEQTREALIGSRLQTRKT